MLRRARSAADAVTHGRYGREGYGDSQAESLRLSLCSMCESGDIARFSSISNGSDPMVGSLCMRRLLVVYIRMVIQAVYDHIYSSSQRPHREEECIHTLAVPHDQCQLIEGSASLVAVQYRIEVCPTSSTTHKTPRRRQRMWRLEVRQMRPARHEKLSRNATRGVSI